MGTHFRDDGKLKGFPRELQVPFEKACLRVVVNVYQIGLFHLLVGGRLTKAWLFFDTGGLGEILFVYANTTFSNSWLCSKFYLILLLHFQFRSMPWARFC